MTGKNATVMCPACTASVPAWSINMHLDGGCKSAASPAPPTLKRKSSAIDLDAPKPSKSFKSTTAIEEAKPLAERVRPTSLDDFVGQRHLLAPGALLRNLIDRDTLGSMLLWGPPGTGKTTIARVIAQTTKAAFRELSATSANTADLRKLFDEAANMLKLTGRRTILFIDEIQRFTKAQQDLFLPEVERGTIQCILATTENPSFRIQSALLSRCRVFVLEKHTVEDCLTILKRALNLYVADHPSTSTASSPVDDNLLHFLAGAADGDARVALSSLELALAASNGSSLKREDLMIGLRKAHLQYDRTGDNHYDTISALHKSIRGSDANAALYWLARMLEGGEDPLYVARRLVRMAAEDVGDADPQALPLAVAAYESAKLIGMPECDCILAQCAVHLAEAPKSVRVYKAYGAAKALVRNEQAHPVPMHIRNAPTKLMRDLGYGREYRYEPSYAHPVYQPFLPPELEEKCHFLEGSDKDRRIDLPALHEWETKRNAGARWPGRDTLPDV